jgi:hypothetical protein
LSECDKQFRADLVDARPQIFCQVGHVGERWLLGFFPAAEEILLKQLGGLKLRDEKRSE